MADRYVVASGGLTSGSASTVGTAWTLAYANSNLAPGDVALLQNGTYTTQIRPANTASSSNRIRYVGDGNAVEIATTANAMADLSDRPYVSLEDLFFFSFGKAWVHSNGAADGIWLINCEYDSDETAPGAWGGTGYAPTGITLPGDDCLIQNSRLLRWLGPDGIRTNGLRMWVKDSYFGNSGHGTLHMSGDYYVVQRCYFRNKWARAANFSPDSSDTGDQLYGLVEDCIFFDSNYIDLANEGDPAKGWVVNIDSDGPGDEQAVGKAGGSYLIFRNNLIVRTHTTQAAVNVYRADLQIGNYADSPAWRNIHAYHNTHLDGEIHPWSITYRSAGNMDARNQRFLNNIWMPIATDKHGIDNVGFWFNTTTANDGSGSYNLMDTWEFRNNITPRGFRHGSVRTVSEFEGLFPTKASGNLSGSATFVDDDYSAAVADRDLEITRSNFFLAPGSVGEDAAAPLATVVTTANDTNTVAVSDAGFFHPGHGVLDGDQIIIGGQVTRVIAVNNTANTLTVNPAIDVTSGDEIWYSRYGASPNIGIVELLDDSEEEEPTSIAFTLLDTVTGSTNATTLATNTLSPAPNSVLVISASGNNTTSGALSVPMSIDDTFTQELTWEKVETNRGTGLGVGVALFVAVLDGSTDTGVVTVTFANTVSSKIIHSIQVENVSLVDPTVQTASNATGNSTPFVITYSSSPLASSASLATVASRGTGTFSATEDPDYAEIAESLVGTGHIQAVQGKISGADTTVQWTGTFGGSGIAGVAIEFAIAEVVETISGSADAISDASGSLQGRTYATGAVEGTTVLAGILSAPNAPLSISIQPDNTEGQDAWLAEFSATANLGSIDYMQAGRGSGSATDQRALLRFDLSSIPAGSEIVSAIVRLYLIGDSGFSGNQNISFHRSLVSWSEGSVSWNNQDNTGPVAWSGGPGGAPGTEYEASATDTTAVGAQSLDYDWDVTADIQDFVNGEDNYGWWIIGPETDDSVKTFSTSESATAGFRPELIIEYIEPVENISGSAAGSSTVSGTLIPLWHMLSPGESAGSSVVEGSLIGIAALQGSSAGYSISSATITFIATAKSDAFETLFLSLIFNGTDIPGLAEDASSSPLTELYVSLHTGSPTDTGDQDTNEVAYSGYARVAVPRSALGWLVQEDTVENVSSIVFPEAPSATGPITHVAVGTSATGPGMVLYYGAVVFPLTTVLPFSPRINPGKLRIQED